MEKILVTGGAGYIGSHVVELLINLRKKVYIIDNLSTGYRRLVNKKAKFFFCDIKNYKKVNKIVKDNKIDSIIHLAASLSVNESEKKPKKYYLNNVIGTKNIIHSCQENQIKNLIFSSTCAVYKDKIKSVKENSKLSPKSTYGKTKLSGERLIKRLIDKRKCNFAILRYFNVAGASKSKKIGQISSGDQLFKNLAITCLRTKPKINIYGNDYNTKDGTCVRDYIHVSDIAKIHILVLKKINKEKKSIVLNCGYGKGVSVLEAVREFEKQIKREISIKFKIRRKGDMEKIIANNQKVKKFINWKPSNLSLKKIVSSCINWEKKIC